MKIMRILIEVMNHVIYTAFLIKQIRKEIICLSNKKYCENKGELG